jgi:hypothetical protein
LISLFDYDYADGFGTSFYSMQAAHITGDYPPRASFAGQPPSATPGKISRLLFSPAIASVEQRAEILLLMMHFTTLKLRE